jgi:hypothetical protein
MHLKLFYNSKVDITKITSNYLLLVLIGLYFLRIGLRNGFYILQSLNLINITVSIKLIFECSFAYGPISDCSKIFIVNSTLLALLKYFFLNLKKNRLTKNPLALGPDLPHSSLLW